jgi:hypothetical protein
VFLLAIGGVIGVWAAHLMFELPVWQFSLTVRTGPGRWLVAGGSRRDVRRAADDPRLRRADAVGRPLRRRPLDHVRLLVHGLHLVRQSGGDDRTLADRHLRRHCAFEMISLPAEGQH